MLHGKPIMRRLLFILLLVFLIVFARWSLYTVDAGEFVYVTLLGKHVATWDGSKDAEAGLHFGWPWPIQAAQRLDRRVQLFDLPTTELLTHDPDGKTIDKTLSVEAYVLWRIPDPAAADQFLRRMGTAERARAILGPRINSQLGAAIGQMRMDDLVSVDPGDQAGRTRVDETLSKLHERLLTGLKQQVREEYGIDLVDIRLRRISHPSAVRESIFARIKSERGKKAAEYRSEGDRLASNIASAADAKKRDLLAQARFEEETLKGKAETEALTIRNQAQSQDPEFYAFLKQMEKLQSILSDNKAVLLLSTHRSIFDLLFQPPRPKMIESTPSKEKK